MSEQYKQDSNINHQDVDDDPLAELARIVAGEAETNVSAQSQEIEASDSSALEEQLMQEFSLELEQAAELEAPDFVTDINASIEQVNFEDAQNSISEAPANVETSFVEEASYVEAQSVEIENTVTDQVVEAAPVVSETDFQDGLINALELEIGGASEPSAEQVADIDPVTDVEMNISNMQETLEQELSGQFDTDNSYVEPSSEALVEPVVKSEASLEDDLGAAFANEFEQIASSAPEPIAPEPPVEAIDAPQAIEPIIEPEMAAPVAEVIEPAGDPDLEMDFEAAFAQELQVTTAPEGEGWTETATADAGAAFTAAAAPVQEIPIADHAYAAPNVLDNDPGHVGSVDEISSLDEASIASANDNGGGKKYAVAALVIALFAGVIAAGYGFLGGDQTTVASGTPEIIKADAGPVKVKPEDPGGIVPENQDNASYVDLAGENTANVSQERLNSQTEEPLVLNTGNTDEATKKDDRLVASEDTGATPNAPSSSVQPNVVQTVVVKPDGTILKQPAAPKPIETASNAVTLGDNANVAVKPVPTQVISKPASIDGAQATGDVVVPVASPLPKPVVVQAEPVAPRQVAAAPKPAPQPVAAPAPAAKSEWVVQVSSQRSAEAAQQSFNTMRNRYSALNGRAMSIQRANVNGATYFRVRVQTASRSDANQLCSSLKASGGNCFVTR